MANKIRSAKRNCKECGRDTQQRRGICTACLGHGAYDRTGDRGRKRLSDPDDSPIEERDDHDRYHGATERDDI